MKPREIAEGVALRPLQILRVDVEHRRPCGAGVDVMIEREPETAESIVATLVLGEIRCVSLRWIRVDLSLRERTWDVHQVVGGCEVHAELRFLSHRSDDAGIEHEAASVRVLSPAVKSRIRERRVSHSCADRSRHSGRVPLETETAVNRLQLERTDSPRRGSQDVYHTPGRVAI